MCMGTGPGRPGGIHQGARDRGMVAYRVPTELATLTDGQRGMGSLVGFKRGSRDGFLAGYRSFVCAVRDCYVCGEGGRGGDKGGNVGASGEG